MKATARAYDEVGALPHLSSRRRHDAPPANTRLHCSHAYLHAAGSRLARFHYRFLPSLECSAPTPAQSMANEGNSASRDDYYAFYI